LFAKSDIILPKMVKKQNMETCCKPDLLIFPLKKIKTEEPKGEVKNHNHTASKTVILRKANLHSLEFVLLPLFLILHLAHFDFQARKLGH